MKKVLSIAAIIALIGVVAVTANAAQDGAAYSTYLGGSDDDEGYGIAVDGAGTLYIADVLNNRIRKVDSSAVPSLTFANTYLGGASASQDVTVLNLGNAPLDIANISTDPNFLGTFQRLGSRNDGLPVDENKF